MFARDLVIDALREAFHVRVPDFEPSHELQKVISAGKDSYADRRQCNADLHLCVSGRREAIREIAERLGICEEVTGSPRSLQDAGRIVPNRGYTGARA